MDLKNKFNHSRNKLKKFLFIQEKEFERFSLSQMLWLFDEFWKCDKYWHSGNGQSETNTKLFSTQEVKHLTADDDDWWVANYLWVVGYIYHLNYELHILYKLGVYIYYINYELRICQFFKSSFLDLPQNMKCLFFKGRIWNLASTVTGRKLTTVTITKVCIYVRIYTYQIWNIQNIACKHLIW